MITAPTGSTHVASPDPTTFMRWWDRMDWQEHKFLRDMSRPQRLEYTVWQAEGKYDYIIEADILRRQPLWHLYTNDPIEEVKNEILRDSG